MADRIKNTKQHWDNVYDTKAPHELSWFQPYPSTSLAFLESLHISLQATIIDIGGGDSHFAAALLEKGYQHIWVLDISAKAIERARQRLGEKASNITWVVSDITTFVPPVQFDCWHDRAAFHFLTTEEQVRQYLSIARQAIKKNGYLILGTFSEQGPAKCSGLEIKKYSEASLSALFESAGFEKMECLTEDHVTPFNTKQNFLFCSFRKNKRDHAHHG